MADKPKFDLLNVADNYPLLQLMMSDKKIINRIFFKKIL